MKMDSYQLNERKAIIFLGFWTKKKIDPGRADPLNNTMRTP